MGINARWDLSPLYADDAAAGRELEQLVADSVAFSGRLPDLSAIAAERLAAVLAELGRLKHRVRRPCPTRPPSTWRTTIGWHAIATS